MCCGGLELVNKIQKRSLFEESMFDNLGQEMQCLKWRQRLERWVNDKKSEGRDRVMGKDR